MLNGVLLLFCLSAPEFLVLENASVRVEADPQLFSICYFGAPGGRNYLETVHVSDTERAQGSIDDPGGWHAQVLVDRTRKTTGFGAVDVLYHDASTLVMRQNAGAFFIQKELRLEQQQPRLTLTTTVTMKAASANMNLTLRNAARLPRDATLHIAREDGVVRSLTESARLEDFVEQGERFQSVSFSAIPHAANVVLGAHAVQAMIALPQGGSWVRKMAYIEPRASAYPHETSIFCLLDDSTRSYGVIFQSPEKSLAAGERLVFTEEWRLETKQH